MLRLESGLEFRGKGGRLSLAHGGVIEDGLLEHCLSCLNYGEREGEEQASVVGHYVGLTDEGTVMRSGRGVEGGWEFEGSERVDEESEQAVHGKPSKTTKLLARIQREPTNAW